MGNLDIFDCFEVALTMMLIVLGEPFLQFNLRELILVLSAAAAHQFYLTIWSLFILCIARLTIFRLHILFSPLICQNAKIQINPIFFQYSSLEHREEIEPFRMNYWIRYDFLQHQLVKSIEVICKLLQHQRYYKNKWVQNLQKPLFTIMSPPITPIFCRKLRLFCMNIIEILKQTVSFPLSIEFSNLHSNTHFEIMRSLKQYSVNQEGRQFLPQCINNKMKNKPLINQSNLLRFQKQNLFIVRPKPMNSKSQTTFPLSREIKTPCFDHFEEILPTIGQCIASLEQQAEGEAVMEKAVCLRIRELLRSRGIHEEDRDEIKKENQPPVLNRKGSSKIFRHRQQTNDYIRYKQNHGEEQNRPKLIKVISTKDLNEKENTIYQQKIKALTLKIEEFQQEKAHLSTKIEQLQTIIQTQFSDLEEIKRECQLSKKTKDQQLLSLTQTLQDLQQQGLKNRQKMNTWQSYISQKQREIINLYQLLQK